MCGQIYLATDLHKLTALYSACIASLAILLALQAIMESEPFGISIKNAADAKKLGEDFAKELGRYTHGCIHAY